MFLPLHIERPRDVLQTPHAASPKPWRVQWLSLSLHFVIHTITFKRRVPLALKLKVVQAFVAAAPGTGGPPRVRRF